MLSFVPSLRRKGVFLLLLVFLALAGGLLFFCTCPPKPVEPIVLTIWHNPTGHREDALSLAVDRFNRSVGRERGVVIIVTAIAKSEIMHEKLMSIAQGDPGAPQPPDIVIAYPKSAMPLIAKGALAALDDYFSPEELSAYIPEFIEAGRLGDGRLYVFPIGRSTEGLLVNRTFWDRFSRETGTPVTELATFEGIVRAAERYHEWTDAKTPDIEGDGDVFFMVDNPFNLAQAAFAQLDDDLFDGGRLNVNSPVYERVWRLFFEPTVRGYESVYKGYGTDLAKTGRMLCWTSSTAGITFMPKNVVYDDNTSEPVEFELLPFPVMEGGRKVAIQRAGGFCLFRSTPGRQQAAVDFLKWLTRPEENLRYVEGTGYLPVTRSALETAQERWGRDATGIWRSYVEAIGVMNREYRFLPQRSIANYGELEILYEGRMRRLAEEARKRYRELLPAVGAERAWREATEGAYAKFVEPE